MTQLDTTLLILASFFAGGFVFSITSELTRSDKPSLVSFILLVSIGLIKLGTTL